jgi:hypothetical protein
VDSKFDSTWGGWSSKEPLGLYGVGLWKNIMRVWGKFQSIPDLRLEMAPRLASGMIYGWGQGSK